MENFKKRLLEFARVRYDMGQSKFEDLCGINRGTISAIKVQGPTASIVMKIAIKCPELNLNWLFRGDGAMTIDENPIRRNSAADRGIYENPNENINYLYATIKDAIKDAWKEIKDSSL